MNFTIFPENKSDYKNTIIKKIKNFHYFELSKIDECDFVFVFGGDGTFLKFLNQNVKKEIKIIFINEGRVGFNCSMENLDYLNDDIYNDNYYTNLFYLSSKNNEKAINEIIVDLDEITNVSIFLNSIKMFDIICSRILIVNYIGTTGLARSFRYPIILRDNPSFILDIIDSPLYSYNNNINQPILFSKNQKIEIQLNKEIPGYIKFDNIKKYKNFNKISIRLKKSKCKIYKFDELKTFAKKLKKLK